jgi:hypothetical protein
LTQGHPLFCNASTLRMACSGCRIQDTSSDSTNWTRVLRRKCASEKVVCCCCCCCCCCASCDFARFVRFLTRWTRTGFRFIFIFRKMRLLLMENIKPVREPGATRFIFIFIFRKGWPECEYIFK